MPSGIPIPERMDVVNVKTYGAVGDGVTDDTSAFQAALDILNDYSDFTGVYTTSGGTLYIPAGKYLITSTLEILGNNIQIKGDSGPDNLGRNTWLYYTGSGHLFEFPSCQQAQTAAGFSASGFVIVGGGPNAGGTAFYINTGVLGNTTFRRDLHFYNLGVFEFAKVIDVVQGAGDHYQIGKLTIDTCSLKWNNQVVDFSGQTSCNRLLITNNDATKNHEGTDDNGPVFRLCAFSATITDNILEGQDDTLYIAPTSRDVTIRDNFFEANTGYAIRAYTMTRLWLGMNYYYESNPGVSGESDNMYEIQACDDVYIQEPESRIEDLGGNTNVHWLANALENIVEDTTPQLGGDLDLNSNSIVTTSNGNIPLLPDGSGKVGVNTASPQSILDVQGDASSAGILTLATQKTEIVDGDELGRINFNAPLESSGSDAILPGASIWAEANASFLSTTNTTDIVFGTNNTGAAIERMRLDSLGRLALGDSNPLVPVHRAHIVDADVSDTTLKIQNTAGRDVQIIMGTSSTPSVDNVGVTIVADRTNADIAGDTDLLFKTSSGTTMDTRMVVMHDGLVGIGVTDPDATLEVFDATTQLKLSYDADTAATATVDSGGDITLGCETDKTLVLGEPVYRDINLAGSILSLPTSSLPDVDELKDSTGTDTGISTYAFAPGEGVSGVFELQHDYKEGTDLSFHIHWQGIAAPTGTDKVKWQLIYTVARANEVLGAATTITVETDFDTQYESTISVFEAITGTTFKIGDQFAFDISRVSATADEYGGDALTHTLGIHYQVDTLGSRQIGTK